MKSVDSECDDDPQALKTKSTISDKPMLQQFLSHCCQERHYFFEVKKCGSADCTICKPVRLNSEVVQEIKNFPDPIAAEDNNHYLSFGDVCGMNTTDKHHPSLKKISSKLKILTFQAKLHHVYNANLKLECEECGVW